MSVEKGACRISLFTLIVRHEAVLFGCLFVGFALGIELALLLPIDPWGEWRLARGRATASGRVERVEQQYTKMKLGWWPAATDRCTYSFTLPDGTTRRGRSYLEGQPFALGGRRLEGEIPPARRPTVIVEYDPHDPEISRLRGGRTAPKLTFPKALWFLPMPLIGAVFIAAGVRMARVCAREIREGKADRTSREYHFDRMEVQTVEEFREVCDRWPGPWARAALELFGLLGLPALLVAIAGTMTRWGPPI